MKTYRQRLAATLALSAAFLAPPALAHQEAAVAPAADTSAVSAQETGPALWKVADEDTTIYLFGTIHVLPENVDWYSSPIENALMSSDSIITEIKLDASTQTKAQQLSMARGMLPTGTTLRSLLDEETVASYESALGKIGAPAAAFDQFKPWLAAMTLAVLPLIQDGYSPDAGVDQALVKKVPELQNDGLETIEFQIGVFDGMTMDAQIAFLKEAADGVDDVKPMVDKMVEYWLAGDADMLAKLMNENMENPAVAETFLYSRNRNWASWIDDRLEAPGTVFIAVGAAHLAGEQSVQDILAERGIATDRVQ